ncbi:Sister chromatid cohesion protein 2 [Orbilia oligospora]|uniref:Sister chromatid cohesion protein n=2 Tax=Orbilia oligospora TaxID=2813651 RepID=A0A7C8U1L0_ORBOL|nr:Sister chromatid cohesion protein 2 [Orbilia oligospora]
MEGYNPGYHGYSHQQQQQAQQQQAQQQQQQQHQQQQLYGGGSHPPPGQGTPHQHPPHHHILAPQQQPQQGFYGSQHSGYSYNFNYIPPSPSQYGSSTASISASRPHHSAHNNHRHHHHQQQQTIMHPPGGGGSGGSGSGYPPQAYTTSPHNSHHHPPPPPMASQQQQPLHQHHRQQYSSPFAANNYSATARSSASNSTSSSPRYNPSHSSSHQPQHFYQSRPQPPAQQHRQASYPSYPSSAAASGSVYTAATPSTSSSRGVQAPNTIEEALQYTPLASIQPFHGHIIPIPTIDGSALAAKSEQVGRKVLKDFNKLDPMSKRFRTATSDISGYINNTIEKKGLQLEFKKSKLGSPLNTGTTKTTVEDLLQNSGLGTFETAVLHKLPTYNQKPSKRSPLSTLEDSQQSLNQPPTVVSKVKTPSKPPKTTTYAPSTHQRPPPPPLPPQSQPPPLPPTEASIPRSNFYIEIPPVSSLSSSQSNINGYDRSLTPTKSQQERDTTPTHKAKPLTSDHHSSGQLIAAIVLPPPKEGFTPTDYTTHQEADARILIPDNFKSRKRRKLADQDEHEAQISSVDTRAKAESAINNLQAILIRIFEDEDNLQPDTSGNVLATSSGSFIPPGALGYSAEATGQCLSVGTQVKLDHAIRQVTLYNRLDRMDLDDLLRLLKTCDNTLKVAENLDVKVSEDVGEPSEVGGPVSEWDKKIAFAENSVKACRTILRVMNGGRQEKQLYSEELLTSIHTVIKNLLEGSIVPLIALRSDREEAFKAVMSKKKLLRDLLQDTTKIIKLLTQLISNQEVTEDFLIKMIYTSVALVFIDNATSDKDSVFGVKKVENLRLAAMNALAKIFARYPDQGDGIINEVLSNLERLPVGRQSAKNFQIPGNESIQLISAFMMNLVQSAGTYQERANGSNSRNAVDSDEEMANGGNSEDGPAKGSSHSRDAETVVMKLEEVIMRSMKTAQEKTAYVTSYIVNRALNTAKSSDTSNSRNLLDLMVEDFLEVLDNPEWPAAELFLKIICIKMIHTVDDPKASVPAKSAALEVLGKLGSKISSLFSHLKKIHGDRNPSSSTIDGILSVITDSYIDYHTNTDGKAGHELKEERDAVFRKMIVWKGPFRMILEHLWGRDQKEDADNLQTAWGFFASVWASRLVAGFQQCQEVDASLASDIGRVSNDLYGMITEKAWYFYDDEVNDRGAFKNDPTPMQIRQAYLLIILAGDFCSHRLLILARLIYSIGGDQTSARSKGLKALMNIVEQDTSILEDKGLIPTLLDRCKDASPSVRDSALDIIGKCLNLKPELEPRVLPTICTRAHDMNIPLRKRAIKLLREIYPNTNFPEHKVDIAKCLLMRVVDHESAVAEQARKSFEELWINQFYPQLRDGEDGELSLKGKVIIRERVSVITKVAITNEKLDAPLSSLIQYFLDHENKQVEQNSKVCRLMVQALFDDLVDSTGNDEDKLRRQSIMRTLVVFARASASLFRVDQLDILKPYIKNLSSTDDMAIYRSAIVIFRCVLPGLSAAHSKFLEDVATALLSNVSKLPMTELQEAIFCLSEINKSYDISGRLIAVFCSSFNILKPYFTADTSKLDAQVLRKISRLICIVGLVGNYCPLERYSKEIRLRLAKGNVTFKTPSVSEFIVDTMLRFANENADPSVRKAALEAVGNVAKTHPEQYMRLEVTGAFEEVFKSDQKEFKSLVLKSLFDFLSAEERSSEEALKKGKAPAASKESVANADYDPGRLTGASTATSRDGVSTALAQTFLHYIVDIALSAVDDYGYAAVELTGSVLRQGLVHPKECTPALVALMTCPDARIENVAKRELKTLAQKHESIVERAYMEGFRLAFKYQLEVIESEDGADSTTYSSKLANLYALTVASRKVKKKFLGNLLAALEFDPNKLQVSTTPSHLTYARFVLQNLAYFDYVSFEDVNLVALGLEKIVGSIGTTVVHHIETDILQISLDTTEATKPVDPLVKRRLCMASVVLNMCWNTRTYLRKLYGVTSEAMAKKAKNTKELTKAPTRVVGMGGRGLWDEMGELIMALDSDIGMDNQFREFVELLTVDSEFKRTTEHEDDDLFGGGGGDDDDDDDGPGAGGADAASHRARGRPRKRKTGTTPPPQHKAAKRRKKKGDGSPVDDGGRDDGDD